MSSSGHRCYDRSGLCVDQGGRSAAAERKHINASINGRRVFKSLRYIQNSSQHLVPPTNPTSRASRPTLLPLPLHKPLLPLLIPADKPIHHPRIQPTTPLIRTRARVRIQARGAQLQSRPHPLRHLAREVEVLAHQLHLEAAAVAAVGGAVGNHVGDGVELVADGALGRARAEDALEQLGVQAGADGDVVRLGRRDGDEAAAVVVARLGGQAQARAAAGDDFFAHHRRDGCQEREVGVGGGGAAEHDGQGRVGGADGAARDGCVVEGGGGVGGAEGGGDGERGGRVDGGEVDEDLVAAVGGEDASVGVEVDAADVGAFGDHRHDYGLGEWSVEGVIGWAHGHGIVRQE